MSHSLKGVIIWNLRHIFMKRQIFCQVFKSALVYLSRQPKNLQNRSFLLNCCLDMSKQEQPFCVYRSPSFKLPLQKFILSIVFAKEYFVIVFGVMNASVIYHGQILFHFHLKFKFKKQPFPVYSRPWHNAGAIARTHTITSTNQEKGGLSEQ